MNKNQLKEAKELISQLQGYQHKYIKEKVDRLFEIINVDDLDKLVKGSNNALLEYTVQDSCEIIVNELTKISNAHTQTSHLIQKHDRIHSDLTHAIELLDASDEDLLIMVKRMKENQRYRRIYKNIHSNTQNAMNYLRDSSLINKINKMNKHVQLKEAMLNKQTYKPKVLKELNREFKELEHVEVDMNILREEPTKLNIGGTKK